RNQNQSKQYDITKVTHVNNTGRGGKTSAVITVTEKETVPTNSASSPPVARAVSNQSEMTREDNTTSNSKRTPTPFTKSQIMSICADVRKDFEALPVQTTEEVSITNQSHSPPPPTSTPISQHNTPLSPLSGHTTPPLTFDLNVCTQRSTQSSGSLCNKAQSII